MTAGDTDGGLFISATQSSIRSHLVQTATYSGGSKPEILGDLLLFPANSRMVKVDPGMKLDPLVEIFVLVYSVFAIDQCFNNWNFGNRFVFEENQNL